MSRRIQSLIETFCGFSPLSNISTYSFRSLKSPFSSPLIRSFFSNFSRVYCLSSHLTMANSTSFSKSISRYSLSFRCTNPSTMKVYLLSKSAKADCTSICCISSNFFEYIAHNRTLRITFPSYLSSAFSEACSISILSISAISST